MAAYRPEQLARIAAGTCFDCPDPVEPGHLRCKQCAEKLRTRARNTQGALYRWRREKNLCVVCGEPATVRIYCHGCYIRKQEIEKTHAPTKWDRVRRSQEKNKEKKLCIACGEPSIPQQFYCIKHYQHRLDAAATRAAKAKASPTCKCGADKVGKTKFCMFHWVRTTLVSSGMDENLTQPLIDKWTASNGVCFYTGIQLIPGLNASIDHVLSQKTHPGLREVLGNLVWADLAVNFMKRESCPSAMLDVATRLLARGTMIRSLEAQICASVPPVLTPASAPAA